MRGGGVSGRDNIRGGVPLLMVTVVLAFDGALELPTVEIEAELFNTESTRWKYNYNLVNAVFLKICKKIIHIYM